MAVVVRKEEVTPVMRAERKKKMSDFGIFMFGIIVGLIFSPIKGLILVDPTSSMDYNYTRRGGAATAKAEQQVDAATAKDETTMAKNPNKKTFTELLIESKSDKYDRHHFEQYYSKWFEPFRAKPGVRVLEIGARDGKSMELWNNYFVDPASILGLAYGAFTENLGSKVSALQKVRVFFGDQSKKETMDYLNEQGPWDIVIDDGSHVPQHVTFTLFSLWKSVSPGGIFVIEDIETSYWPHQKEIYGYRLNHTGIGVGAEYSVVTKIEQIQQVLVRHQIGNNGMSIMPGDEDICSIEWGMNLVVFRKCGPGVKKPPYQKKTFDATQMNSWMENAKRTNPIVE